MQNIFENPAFSMSALTAAINILPNRYGRLEELSLMPPKPVRQRQIVVEEMNGVLNLLPTLPPGSPGTVGVRGKRKLRSFVVPHIPHDDVVLPEEVQGIRAFGSETETETVAGVIARHLETMLNKHSITLERTHAQVLKRDRMLVAHRLQMACDHARDGLGFRFRTEGADALHFFGQHHVVVRDVRHNERAQLALAAYTDRAGRTRRQRGQQVEHAVHFLDDDLALTHRLRWHQAQFFQTPVAVGQDVDGGGQRRHRKRWVLEDVLHGQTP
jgi:hypothetical protein